MYHFLKYAIEKICPVAQVLLLILPSKLMQHTNVQPLTNPKKNVNALFGYNNNIVYVNINNNNQLDFNMKLKFSVDDIFFYLLILTKNGGSPDHRHAYMQELSREEYSITQVYEYIESSYTDLPYIVL
jgi:hypothetical protein